LESLKRRGDTGETESLLRFKCALSLHPNGLESMIVNYFTPIINAMEFVLAALNVISSHDDLLGIEILLSTWERSLEEDCMLSLRSWNGSLPVLGR
jgi:hypothetical protein